MDAAVALNRSGGWPLSVFLTPEAKPFWAGTYLPPVPRHGLRSFSDILSTVAEVWRTRRDEIDQTGDSLTEHLRPEARYKPPDAPIDAQLISTALESLTMGFDREWGGWGNAPKFPPAATLEFLLRRSSLAMAEKTLDAMAAGGMYDLVGGGFHRYSVDRRWLVPHFEKMLYDNAQLAVAYLHGWLVLGKERYRRVAEQTVEYMLRELALAWRRLRLGAGRRHRRRRGAHLHLDARGGRAGRAAPPLRGQPVRAPRRARRGEARRALRAARAAAEAGARRQGGCVLERARARRPRRMRPFPRPSRLDRGRPPPGGVPARAALDADDGQAAPNLARAVSPREPATSRTTPTSRTGCSSCTWQPASSAGSRRRTGLRSARARALLRRRERRLLPGSGRRRAARGAEEELRRPSRAERQHDARLRAAPARAHLRRRRCSRSARSRCFRLIARRADAGRRRPSAGGSSRSTSTSRRGGRSRSSGRVDSRGRARRPRPLGPARGGRLRAGRRRSAARGEDARRRQAGRLRLRAVRLPVRRSPTRPTSIAPRPRLDDRPVAVGRRSARRRSRPRSARSTVGSASGARRSRLRWRRSGRCDELRAHRLAAGLASGGGSSLPRTSGRRRARGRTPARRRARPGCARRGRRRRPRSTSDVVAHPAPSRLGREHHPAGDGENRHEHGRNALRVSLAAVQLGDAEHQPREREEDHAPQ